MPPGTTRVILLDLDDTLIADVPAANEAIALTLSDLDLPHDAAAVDVVLRSAREAWRANPDRGHPELDRVSSWEALWVEYEALDLPAEAARRLAGHDRRVWHAALRELTGDGGPAEAAASAFRRLRGEAVRPLPGVLARLDALAARHVLWLATDGCRSLQRGKLFRAGLADRFAKAFVSAEVGCGKSDPAFARTIQAHLDADGREMCLVAGDSAATDLRLAAAGGWPAVHICGATGCRAPTEPVWHSTDTTDLAAYCRCEPDLTRTRRPPGPAN
jgi:FMN phosphatase YigB (HAD superfamily)